MDPKDIITIDISDIHFDSSMFSSASTVDISTSLPPLSSIDTITIDSSGYIDWIFQEEKRSEWVEINNAAKDNPELQRAIERVKILYHLSKDENDGDSETGHKA